MNTQIYLMLVRKVNPNLPTAAKVLAMIKNFVMGDSLDAPFIKFIKVQSVSHSIAFGGEQSVTERVAGSDTAKTYKTDTGGSIGDYEPARMSRHKSTIDDKDYRAYGDRWKHNVYTGPRGRANHTKVTSHKAGFFPSYKNNQYLNIHLPDHDDFTFTKMVDNSTPQLAYGCSAQEPFYYAAFFFRRRIGLGVEGMRMPFMGLILTKCLLSSWKLEDETETISLKYKDIMWGTFDQVADINAPTGMSSRVWSTETNEGGETGKGYLVQALLAGVTAAGVGMTAALGGFSEEVSTGS